MALKFIGSAFLLLAIYVRARSLWALWVNARPAPSSVDMAWLVATIAATLLLAWGALVTGHQLSTPVLKAEGRVTLIDAALAGAVLLGVGLNTLFGWWWADPLAGLIIVYYGLKEGRASWKHATAHGPATYDNGGDV